MVGRIIPVSVLQRWATTASIVGRSYLRMHLRSEVLVVPLRSELPPLLFLLDINDLKTVVPTDADFPILTDDVSLFCSHPGKLIAQDARLAGRPVTKIYATWRRGAPAWHPRLSAAHLVQFDCSQPWRYV